MSQKDYYEILEVSKTATAEEIKKAYRKIAFEYHPDRNPGNAEAEAKFKDAASAYDVLRDEEKRARYDRFGHEGVNGGGFGGFSNDDIFSQFGDIFGDLFGFGGRRQSGPRPTRGEDLRFSLEVDFRQAHKGDDIKFSIPRNVTCSECDGEGAAKGTSRQTCSTCNGAGQVFRRQGPFQFAAPCHTCAGRGYIIPTPCSKCRGTGLVEESRELTVHIPAGVYDGARLRLRGEGEAGTHGGPHGDLYVLLRVGSDKVFEREDQDLIFTLNLTFPKATLGARITIPTLDGDIEFDVPKGTQSGAVFRLPNKGFPYPGEKRIGDMQVRCVVKTPKDLSPEQKELLELFEAFTEKKEAKISSRLKKEVKKMGKVIGLNTED